MTNVEVRVRSTYDSLSNAEKKVATYFLDNVDRIFSLPIAQLAEESGVSQIAWVRFSKTLGFDGLKDLKKNLFEDLNDALAEDEKADEGVFTDVRDYTSIDQMAKTVKNSSIKAIEHTIKLLDVDTMQQIADLVINAKTIRIFGVGASALVAEDLNNKLMRIGKNVYFGRDSHLQLTYGSCAGKEDVCIFISNSGNTKEILEILQLVKASECPTVALTQFRKSSLAGACDYVLYTSSPEIYRRSGAMSSRIAQLILVDVLFTAIANTNYDEIESYLERSYESCDKHKMC